MVLAVFETKMTILFNMNNNNTEKQTKIKTNRREEFWNFLTVFFFMSKGKSQRQYKERVLWRVENGKDTRFSKKVGTCSKKRDP